MTYSIIDGSDKFAIDSTGRITLRRTLPEGTYNGRVRAADGGTPSKSTDEAITLIVRPQGVVDECPVFASDSLSRTVTILETHDPQVGYVGYKVDREM